MEPNKDADKKNFLFGFISILIVGVFFLGCGIIFAFGCLFYVTSYAKTDGKVIELVDVSKNGKDRIVPKIAFRTRDDEEVVYLGQYSESHYLAKYLLPKINDKVTVYYNGADRNHHAIIFTLGMKLLIILDITGGITAIWFAFYFRKLWKKRLLRNQDITPVQA
jgi:hypothetical protein